MNIELKVNSSELIAEVAKIVLDYTNTQLSSTQINELTKKILNDEEVKKSIRNLITFK